MILVEIVLAPILKPKKKVQVLYDIIVLPRLQLLFTERMNSEIFLEGFVKELHSEDTICTVILDIKLMIS